MFKKAAILCLVSIIGLFSGTINSCFAATADTLGPAEQNVISLIATGNLTDADAATAVIIALPVSQEKGQALQQIAGAYQNAKQYDRAINVSDYILQNWPQESFAVWTAMTKALSQLGKEDITDANSTTDSIIANYADNNDLSNVLSIMADIYSWHNKHYKAQQLYSVVAGNSSNGPLAAKAQLCIAREKVMQLIEGENYPLAAQQINSLTSDFAGNPDLSETLYRIAERYKWSGKFTEAKGIYQQIVQNDPNSPYATKANLGILRVTAMSQIMSQDYGNAQGTINKLVAGFSMNPDLPETLYWIAEKYRLFSSFEEEKGLYQLIQQQPDNPYTNKAKLGIARADVMSLIMTKDYDGAQKALDKLVADFSVHPDLPEALCWIAERYEWQNKFAEAKGVYQQIIQNYPNSSYVNQAKLGASMADVRSLIMAQDNDGAQQALDKVVVDFAGHPDLPKSIIIAGEQYYKYGLSKASEGLADQAKDNFERAVTIWEGFINNYSNTSLIPEACCWAGDCYNKLGKYSDSIRCFAKVAKDYPNYNYVWHATFMIGRNYERMEEAGLISKSDADPKIKVAYTQLVTKYPTSTPAKIAQEWLDSNKSQQGE